MNRTIDRKKTDKYCKEWEWCSRLFGLLLIFILDKNAEWSCTLETSRWMGCRSSRHDTALFSLQTALQGMRNVYLAPSLKYNISPCLEIYRRALTTRITHNRCMLLYRNLKNESWAVYICTWRRKSTLACLKISEKIETDNIWVNNSGPQVEKELEHKNIRQIAAQPYRIPPLCCYRTYSTPWELSNASSRRCD